MDVDVHGLHAKGENGWGRIRRRSEPLTRPKPLMRPLWHGMPHKRGEGVGRGVSELLIRPRPLERLPEDRRSSEEAAGTS